MNYGQVKTQFTGLMNRRDLTANPALVDTFCQQALARAQRKLRVPAMEKSADLTIADGYSNSVGLAIPSDLVELKEISYSDDTTARTLREAPLGITLRAGVINAPDHPYMFARRGSTWVLGPLPTAGDVLRVDYWAELPALVEDTDSNWLTEIAPDVLVYGALSFAADYYTDKRVAGFEQRFSNALDELQEQADEDELTMGAAVVPAYFFDDECQPNG
jgi:hypothetical protein